MNLFCIFFSAVLQSWFAVESVHACILTASHLQVICKSEMPVGFENLWMKLCPFMVPNGVVKARGTEPFEGFLSAAPAVQSYPQWIVQKHCSNTSLELLFACLCDSAHKCFKNVNIESFVLQTDSCRAAWPTYQWVTKQFFIVRYVLNSSWYKWFIRF